MKISNPDLIKHREKELLEIISGDLDRGSTKKLLAAKYHLNLDGDKLVCRGGDLVVHDNQVAYKIEYEAVVTLSLLFDRRGECLEAKLLAEGDPVEEEAAVPESGAAAAAAPAAEDVVPAERGGRETGPGRDEPEVRLAASIADMIAEINRT